MLTLMHRHTLKHGQLLTVECSFWENALEWPDPGVRNFVSLFVKVGDFLHFLNRSFSEIKIPKWADPSMRKFVVCLSKSVIYLWYSGFLWSLRYRKKKLYLGVECHYSTLLSFKWVELVMNSLGFEKKNQNNWMNKTKITNKTISTTKMNKTKKNTIWLRFEPMTIDTESLP